MMVDIDADRVGDLFAATNGLEFLFALDFLMHGRSDREKSNSKEHHHRHHGDKRHPPLAMPRTATAYRHRRRHHLSFVAAAPAAVHGSRPVERSGEYCPEYPECSARAGLGSSNSC